jgi:hypothetical protein
MPLKTIATYATSPDLLLQHLYEQVQHTSETLETLETYICNIGEEEAKPVDSSRRGWGSRPLPCNTVVPPSWILLVLYGSHRGVGEGHRIYER